MDERTGHRPRLLGGLLSFAMAASTVSAVGLGVIAADVISDLNISTVQIGILVAGNTLVGAIMSPLAGQLSDRVSDRRALLAVFGTSGAGLAIMAMAGSFLVMLLGMVVAALATALSNPSTNRVIVANFEPGRRGWVTGIKQSGVQVAVFGSGVLLPVLALRVGWRGSLLVIAALILAAIPVTLKLVGRETTAVERSPELSSMRRRFLPNATVVYLGGYAFLIGFANSSRVFIPLFAQEQLGVSLTLAGLALGLVGLAAIVGRIVWARVAENRGAYRPILKLFAFLGAVAFGLVFLSSVIQSWLVLAAGSVLLGLSASSWNSVATLAVLRTPALHLGASSGFMMFGFFSGIGLGSPTHGAAIDLSGDFSLVWIIAVGSILLGWLVIGRWPEIDDQ